MNFNVFAVFALILNILLNDLLIAMFANSRNVIAIAPEFAAPELLLHLWRSGKDLSSRETFHDANDLGRSIDWHRLDEKVNMVSVSADFDKVQIVAFGKFQTDVLEDVVNFFSDNYSAVLGGTD